MNPRELGSTRLDVTQSWLLQLGETPPKEILFETYAFPQTPYQRISYSSTPQAQEASDGFNNSRLRFVFQPAGEKQKTLELKAVAEISYYGAALEPLAQGETEKYLQATELTEATSAVKATAASVAGTAVDDYEAVTLLTEWVRNNVDYDASYWKKEIQAERVLAEKRGVCNQFATLLIALLRSRGIPARFTAGLVYSGESWGAHAWVEAGIAGNGADGSRSWLPVDPTFGEVGVLDAGHLKFGHGLNQRDISETATAGVDVVKSEPSVVVAEKSDFGDLFDVSLNAPSVVGAGSAEEIALAVKSKASGAIALPFVVIVPSQPQSLAVRAADGSARIIYLQPGEEKAVSWLLVFPRDLREGFTYNFSVEVQGFGEKTSTTIQGKADAESKKFEKLSITRFAAQDAGAKESFSIVVVNEGNEKIDAVDVVGEFGGVKQRETFSLGPSEEKLVAFVFAKPAAPGIYAGSFKARDAVSGASAEQPFQLEIMREEPNEVQNLPSIAVSAKQIPEDYVIYAAAVVFAAALVYAIVRARRANRRQLKQSRLTDFSLRKN
ncbi:MAG: transglutaminase-like domain-containing protein [Candidatus Micrarchaeota archaeon]